MLEKHKAYSAYKNAGVEFLDVIPSGWDVLRGKLVFKEFAERSLTGAETLLSVSEYYGVKPRAIVMADGDFLSRAESLVDYKKCSKNDLVMNIMLAWKRGLGVTKFDGIVSPAYSVFRFNERASPDYMHYLLRTDTYTNHFKTRSTGVIDSRLRLYPESFGNVPVILPSINEQQKIANFLDHETAKIDTLIEKQQQLIKLLKEKRQAVISHAVTKGLNPNASMRDSGVEWLGEVPDHWVSCALKYYARVVDCKHITAEFFDEGIPLASISEVKEWHVNLASAKLTNEKYYLDLIGGGRKPEPGDIIYSRNATVGEAALVMEGMPDFAMGQDVCLIRLDDDVLSEYILYVLKSRVISNQLDLAMVGSTFKRINVDDIRNFAVALPSFEEQVEIVKELTQILGKYDTLVVNAEKTISLMTERRTALISAAVTGKIDVRNWQAPKPSSTNNKEDAA